MTTTQRGVFDFLRTRGEEFINQVSNELLSNPRFIRAMQTAMKGKQWFDDAVAQAMKTMNVPTRTEFKRAVARVEALEHEVAEMKRQVAAAERARTTARATARKKAKKTAARKKKPAQAATSSPGAEAGSSPAE